MVGGLFRSDAQQRAMATRWRSPPGRAAIAEQGDRRSGRSCVAFAPLDTDLRCTSDAKSSEMQRSRAAGSPGGALRAHQPVGGVLATWHGADIPCSATRAREGPAATKSQSCLKWLESASDIEMQLGDCTQ